MKLTIVLIMAFVVLMASAKPMKKERDMEEREMQERGKSVESVL